MLHVYKIKIVFETVRRLFQNITRTHIGVTLYVVCKYCNILNFYFYLSVFNHEYTSLSDGVTTEL